VNGKSIIAFPSAARALAALDKLSTEIDEAPSLQAVEAIAMRPPAINGRLSR
jgi:hypothetical protein